jgi:hypothetical protein
LWKIPIPDSEDWALAGRSLRSCLKLKSVPSWRDALLAVAAAGAVHSSA